MNQMKELAEYLNHYYLKWQANEGTKKSIGDFAEHLDVPEGSLGHWMNGIRNPSRRYADKLADRLGDRIYDILQIARPDPDYKKLQHLYDMTPKDQLGELVVIVEKWLQQIGARRED